MPHHLRLPKPSTGRATTTTDTDFVFAQVSPVESDDSHEPP